MTGLLRLAHQVVEVAQLVLAVAELQRQMHQENRDVVELELDDQAFDAGIEVVKTLAAHPRRGQKGVRLLAHDGHQSGSPRTPYLHSKVE